MKPLASGAGATDSSRRLRACLAPAVAAAALLLQACAGTPPSTPSGPAELPQDPPPVPTVELPPEPTAYELRERDRALALARQGRLAEAALVWEVLATIRPKVAEYRERGAEVQRQIDAAVADRLQKGAQAAARGQAEVATQHYLQALSLQPQNAQAADALRGLERERIKRSNLGKLSRITLTRRANAEAEMAPSAEAGTVTARPSEGGDSNELEHASLLASQGEYDEAIALLERRLRANRRDDATRALLADVYFQKAEVSAAARNGRPAAITLLERAVRTDPQHARAAERLKQLRPVVSAARPASAPASGVAGAAVAGSLPMASGAVKPAVATVTGPAPAASAPAAVKR
jgi:tetratricopeptide (TPR) repeat protein